jgi:hypothetical protein
MTRITGALHEDQKTFLNISLFVLLRMRNVSDKNCRENQNAYSVSVLCFENRAVCEIMGKNTVQPDRPQTTVWRVRTACCIRKAANTHSELCNTYSFPLQQCLHEPAAMLRYTCT